MSERVTHHEEPDIFNRIAQEVALTQDDCNMAAAAAHTAARGLLLRTMESQPKRVQQLPKAGEIKPFSVQGCLRLHPIDANPAIGNRVYYADLDTKVTDGTSEGSLGLIRHLELNSREQKNHQAYESRKLDIMRNCQVMTPI